MLVGILTMGYYLTKSLFKKNEKNWFRYNGKWT
jgi:hypothetical protein